MNDLADRRDRAAGRAQRPARWSRWCRAPRCSTWAGAATFGARPTAGVRRLGAAPLRRPQSGPTAGRPADRAGQRRRRHGRGAPAISRVGSAPRRVVLPGVGTVAALVAVNAAGSPIDPRTGELLGAHLLLPADGPPPPSPDDAAREALLTGPPRPGRRGIGFAAPSDAEADVDRQHHPGGRRAPTPR